MQLTQPVEVEPANAENNQKAFWSEVKRIAVKGIERPESLTREEIRHICQVALVGMTARVMKQQG